jgi:hypothetical protein
LWVIDNDNVQFVHQAAREGGGNLFNNRESKNFVYHGAILRLARHKIMKAASGRQVWGEPGAQNSAASIREQRQ